MRNWSGVGGFCWLHNQKNRAFAVDTFKSPWHIERTVSASGSKSSGDDSPAHLLSLIREHEATTRADLIRLTGLARSTIAQRVDWLLSSGLLVEIGEARSTGGRPPTLFGFNGEAGVVLAADLGATHSRVAVTNLAAEPLVEQTVEWAIDDGPDAVLTRLEALFDELLVKADKDIGDLRGIGIGLPGPVDFVRGMAINPPIMSGWHEYPVADRFKGRYSVPVLVDNDVNIMALGEHFSTYPEVADLVFVKVGTGIGSGLILGGRLHRGAQGAAGDIGHVQAAGQETVCRCGNNGCLEAAAGGAALASALGNGRQLAGSRDVVRLVAEGDESAVRAVRSAGRMIGQVLASMVNLLNPSVILIGGDMAGAGQQLLAGIREVVYRRSTTLSTTALEIATSSLGDRAGVTGAAAMVIDHILEPGNLEASLAVALARDG